MTTRNSIFVLLFVGLIAFSTTGCDQTVEAPEPFAPTGTVSGRLLDRTTAAPIAGAVITIDAATEEDASASTTTTDSLGTFRFRDVPVNGDRDASGRVTGEYSLHLDLSGVSGPYRPFYAAKSDLTFESTGGDGAANQLTTSVTIPLSKLTASITGRAVSGGDPVSGSTVTLWQELPLSFDAGGSPDDFTPVKVATTTTGSNGGFTFNDVEENTSAALEFNTTGEDAVVVNNIRIPASSDGSNAALELGDVDVSTSIQAFSAELVSPADDADLDTNSPAFQFVFTNPIATNPYTRTDAPFGAGTMIDDVNLSDAGPKTTRPDGNLEVSVSLNSARDTLTVSPVNPLRDGREYVLSMNAFTDNDFVDVYGQGLTGTSTTTSFSVGINNSAPAAPSLSFADGSQSDANYTTFTVNEDFSIPLDESAAPVKRYELFASVEGEPLEYVRDISVGDFGETNFSETFSNSPLAADRGAYTPIRVAVRAVSDNLVRSDLSNELTIEDNVALSLFDADDTDIDGDGEIELVVEYDEPVDPSSIDLGDYEIIRSGSAVSPNPLTGVQDIVNDASFGGTDVILNVDNDNFTFQFGDEVRVTSQTDLAGNGFDGGEETTTVD